MEKKPKRTQTHDIKSSAARRGRGVVWIAPSEFTNNIHLNACLTSWHWLQRNFLYKQFQNCRLRIEFQMFCLFVDVLLSFGFFRNRNNNKHEQMYIQKQLEPVKCFFVWLVLKKLSSETIRFSNSIWNNNDDKMNSKRQKKWKCYFQFKECMHRMAHISFSECQQSIF